MQPIKNVVVMVALLLLSGPLGAQTSKPPAAPADVPDIRSVKTTIVCADCDKPFDIGTHKQVLDGLVSNVYVGELRRALYLQDSLHQFESKAHFDNCDFDGATTYIDSLLGETEGHVRAAQHSKAKGDTVALGAAVKKAFFTIGQALHAVQDFYAHTNYVELAKAQVKKATDIPIIAPWRKLDKERIKELRGKGLVSGFVFWGIPQLCPSGTISHSDLAKDKETTKSGSVKLPHLQNLTQYQLAAFLAREASQELLNDAFRRWPLLKEVNGSHVAFEVLVDRRGL